MSPQPPSAKPPPASRRILRIAIWGLDAQPMADAVWAHSQSQAGWSERITVQAHTLLDPSAAAPDYQHWLANELKESGKPHLSLLIPSQTSARITEASELLLRAALQDAGVSYQVLYGTTTAEQILNAANAIVLTAKTVLPSSENACFSITNTTQPVHPRMRSWSCEKCSDPECEHRLFTGLTTAA